MISPLNRKLLRDLGCQPRFVPEQWLAGRLLLDKPRCVVLPATLARMKEGHELQLMHVPDTGHTPILHDRNQIHFIGAWLATPRPDAGEWCVLHAR